MTLGSLPAAVSLLVVLGTLAVAAKDFDQAKICEAVRNGWELRVVYRPGEGERVVIPRYLGYTKARNLILNGLQISGASESGDLPGHRSFRLDRTTDIQFTTKPVPSRTSSSKRPN